MKKPRTDSTAKRLATMAELEALNVPRVVRNTTAGRTYHTMNEAVREGAISQSDATIIRKELRQLWAAGHVHADIYCSRGQRWHLVALNSRKRGA